VKTTATLALALIVLGCASSAERERNDAARRGYVWLAGYLADDANADSLGWDAVQIGLEPAVTSPALREPGRAWLDRHGRRFAKVVLETTMPLDTEETLDLLRLAAEAERLGLDPAPLRARLRETFDGLRDPDGVLGFEPLEADAIAGASTEEVFDLLLATYVVERARVLGLWPGGRFGLADLLPVLARRPVPRSPADPEAFRDHVYLLTHVAYVLDDYGRLRRRRSDAPWVYDGLARVFPEVLADRDVELVAEIVDVFRGVDGAPGASRILRDGTRFLLESQNADGSWGDWQGLEDPYDRAHFTWCAATALRERRFLEGTPWERHVREILGIR
jgi:hypothetical protein